MNFQQHSPGSFRVLPPVVKNILIINGLFFLATISLGRAFHMDLTEMFGLHYITAPAFRPYQVITYMFMHGGLGHIFFNMFAVWMFGNVLENVWGGKRFLIYYLVTGIGAAFTHYAIMYYFELRPVLEQINAFLANPDLHYFNRFMDSDAFRIVSESMQEKTAIFVDNYNRMVHQDPEGALQSAVDFMIYYRGEYLSAPVVIGASGAVFGILLAFGVLFPNSMIYIYFAIPIKAKYFVILYGVLELYAGIANKGSNVAHFAHLGGMVFGFLLIMLWRKRSSSY